MIQKRFSNVVPPRSFHLHDWCFRRCILYQVRFFSSRPACDISFLIYDDPSSPQSVFIAPRSASGCIAENSGCVFEAIALREKLKMMQQVCRNRTPPFRISINQQGRLAARRKPQGAPVRGVRAGPPGQLGRLLLRREGPAPLRAAGHLPLRRRRSRRGGPPPGAPPCVFSPPTTPRCCSSCWTTRHRACASLLLPARRSTLTACVPTIQQRPRRGL